MSLSFQLIPGPLPTWEGITLYAAIATASWSLIARLTKSRAIFTLLMVPGVFLHETLHFSVGFITNAKPSSFSIIPNRVQAGSVSFSNITWYNAIPTALAPLLGLLFASIIATSHLPTSMHGISGENLLFPLLLSPLAYACWPSSVDWKLSLHGWPVYVGGSAYLAHVAGWIPASVLNW